MFNKKVWAREYWQRPEVKEKARERQAKRRQVCLEEMRAYDALMHRKYRLLSPWHTRLKLREFHHLDKVKVLSHYSNPPITPICNNCGEQDIDVLCLDHIGGGGTKHTRSIGMTLYTWILQNNYPEGFQVLCANCNSKKARLEFFTSRVISNQVLTTLA